MNTIRLPKVYLTRVTCALCGAHMQVETAGRQKLTEEGRQRIKDAGWQFVATIGLYCGECRQKKDER